MHKLIKADKNSLFFLLRAVFLIFLVITLYSSCKPILGKKNKSFDIKFKSLYDEDQCTLTINGKEYYYKEIIITDRSLGIDLNKRITIEEDLINMKIIFEALIDAELEIRREINLDTTLNIKNGFNIIILAGSDRIKIQQQSEVYELE